MKIAGRNQSSFVLSILTVFCLLGSLGVRAQEQPKPGPAHKKLEVWVGEWSYEGDGKQSPFGPGGKFKGKQTSRMVLNGFFLESRWEDKGDTGHVTQGIVIQGYDPVKKVYVDHGFESDGSASPGTTTVDGNTWTGSGTRADSAGKVYKMRFVATVSADARTVANKAEYSGDDGKTWVKWWELTMKKSK